MEGDQLIKDGMNVPIRLSDGEALRGIIRGECESFNVHRLPRFATVIESLVCKETITMSRLINGELRSSSKIRPRKLENGFESAAPRSFAPSFFSLDSSSGFNFLFERVKFVLFGEGRIKDGNTRLSAGKIRKCFSKKS